MSTLVPELDDRADAASGSSTLVGNDAAATSLMTPATDPPGVRPRGNSDLAYTDTVAWSAQTDISASDIVEKQRLIKDILGMQDGLKGLLARITSVKADCTKAEADNEMLQVYIDSVTKSLAAKS